MTIGTANCGVAVIQSVALSGWTQAPQAGWPLIDAVAQQSCRYLTPLLSRAGENPIHFQLLYSLTVDLVSKHKGEGIQPNTHTSSS